MRFPKRPKAASYAAVIQWLGFRAPGRTLESTTPPHPTPGCQGKGTNASVRSTLGAKTGPAVASSKWKAV